MYPIDYWKINNYRAVSMQRIIDFYFIYILRCQMKDNEDKHITIGTNE